MTRYFLPSVCSGLENQPCGREYDRVEISKEEYEKKFQMFGRPAVSHGLCPECYIKTLALAGFTVEESEAE